MKLGVKFLGTIIAISLLGCNKPNVDEIPCNIHLENDQFQLNQGQTIEVDFLANDVIEGEKIDISIINSLEYGELLPIENSSKYLYKASNSFYGNEAFQYQVCINGECKSAEVSFEVLEIPDSCLAYAIGEDYKIYEDYVEIKVDDLLSNDVSPCSNWDISTFTLSKFTTNGNVSINGNTISFVGSKNWERDQFQYIICNDGGQCKNAIVKIVNGNIVIPIQQ